MTNGSARRLPKTGTSWSSSKSGQTGDPKTYIRALKLLKTTTSTSFTGRKKIGAPGTNRRARLPQTGTSKFLSDAGLLVALRQTVVRICCRRPVSCSICARQASGGPQVSAGNRVPQGQPDAREGCSEKNSEVLPKGPRRRLPRINRVFGFSGFRVLGF